MKRPKDQYRLRQLLDLAHDASSYLRRSPSAAVRASAALLLAASLAACGGTEEEVLAPTGGKSGAEVKTVKPLTREIKAGLPEKPGRYPVHSGSIGRDQQGIYYFQWRSPDEPETARHDAAVSLLRLLRSEENSLEIPEQGDPILRLSSGEAIQLTETAPQRSGTSSVYHYGSPMPWYPFFLMSSFNPAPVYYDPPRTVQSGTRVEGSRSSTTPSSPSERSIGVQSAVSGRAGGAGSGSAVTSRVGSGTGADTGGVSAAKSGSFSSGSGGSSSVGSSGG